MKHVLAAATLFAVLGTGACGIPETESDTDTDYDGPDVTDPFVRFDANGDSVLDGDEIPELAEPAVFDVWDLDGDGEVTAEEARVVAFQLWDTDGNGVVSDAEWGPATDLWFAEDVSDIALTEWDLDDDGTVEGDEFTERFDVTELGSDWRADGLDAAGFAGAYAQLYDADDDGSVTEEEFLAGEPLLDAASVEA